jgi:hypothetical protein
MAINFPLRKAFSMSHRFWYIVLSFSLNSRKFLFPLFLWRTIGHGGTCCLVASCLSVFCCFFCCWILVLMSCGQIVCKGLLHFLLFVKTCFVTSSMVYFGQDSVGCWEECILCCCRMEYSVDIYLSSPLALWCHSSPEFVDIFAWMICLLMIEEY